MTTNILPQALKEVKKYKVKKISEELIINGTGDSPLWEQASELSDFEYPWEVSKASSTTFKALHSQDWLYCLFSISVKDVNVYIRTNEKSEILKSDRVEIFFKKDDNLTPYYGLEIDALARVYDYEARYHRKIETEWSWPANQLIAVANQNSFGYTVEIAIHKDSLHTLGLLENNKIAAGLFRAECVSIKGTTADMKWISWVKPDSRTPDFHIASSFGILDLEP